MGHFRKSPRLGPKAILTILVVGIATGAHAPKLAIAGAGSSPTPWAYQPVRRPDLPIVKNSSWARNEIDRFILAKLEAMDLPAPAAANARTLARRIQFDLTGLPPTEADIAAANHVASDAEWAAQIDRLLASRAYGEQWARHWMDVARYGDSSGYELDYLYRDSWQYRDWLIRSFQQNKPMNRFIEEQIAGDQLWPDSLDSHDGTGFIAFAPRRHEGGIPRKAERDYERLSELTDTIGSVFLGSTLACARCHDHKYDPFTQRDYFGLLALLSDHDIGETHRSPNGKGMDAALPATLIIVPASEIDAVHVLRRGELNAPQAEAPPATPTFLPTCGVALKNRDRNRRAVLARWLVAPENPLTARVLVNRIWQWHFGVGLVPTPSDFGKQGEAPTHPELLNWLASELVSSGWDLNHIHRLILNSATYRATSLASPNVLAHDPNARWLSHFPRRRLSSDELRDSMLSVSGELNDKPFGPPVVIPAAPSELAGLRNAHWDVTRDPSEHRRRSVYLVARRSMQLSFFEAFNSPDNMTSCPMRDRSIVPSQALSMLNSDATLMRARALAGRLWRQSDGDVDRAVELAWRLLFGRDISLGEREAAIAFLADREKEWAGQKVGENSTPTNAGPTLPPAARGAAWVQWALALLNSNEFVYVE